MRVWHRVRCATYLRKTCVQVIKMVCEPKDETYYYQYSIYLALYYHRRAYWSIQPVSPFELSLVVDSAQKTNNPKWCLSAAEKLWNSRHFPSQPCPFIPSGFYIDLSWTNTFATSRHLYTVQFVQYYSLVLFLSIRDRTNAKNGGWGRLWLYWYSSVSLYPFNLYINSIIWINPTLIHVPVRGETLP